ncbi:MAG: hypothetical protein KJO91_13435 [Gammaproteobacteria bacterium]|nr:hypothetical protein [Gammaproteobacteria bacterium]
MPRPTYPGINNDPSGAMHSTGKMIRDAWVFGILPETEDCSGGTEQRLEGLHAEVANAWEPYGHLPSQLPTELREKHARIFKEALEFAKTKGWSADDALKDDH